MKLAAEARQKEVDQRELYWLCRGGDPSRAKKMAPLLSGGRLDVNQRATWADYCTPLQWACTNGDLAAVRLLLKYGADPCHRDHPDLDLPVVEVEVKTKDSKGSKEDKQKPPKDDKKKKDKVRVYSTCKVVVYF
jgi:hypothetical protein